MKTKRLLTLLVAGVCFAVSADNRKLNSINTAKILAERSIVETVYGVKIRFVEEVTDLSDGQFLGTTESKTGQRTIKGIEYLEKYDPKNDIAQVTAVLKLSRIKDIVDTDKFKLDKFPDKAIRRTAFASSTPANTRKLAALRAAEIDAYKNLYKRIGGFTLESNTKVENFVLKSDKVKSTVIGALMGAEYVGFNWEGSGDDAIAVVKLRLNLAELAELLGEKIVDFDGDVVEAEGRAAQAPADARPKESSDQPDQMRKTEIKTIEGKVDVLP